MAKKSKASKKSNKVDAVKDKVKDTSQNVLKEIKTFWKSAQKDMQSQLDDLSSQMKSLKDDIQKPTHNLIEKVEKNYQQRMKAMQKEFDSRLTSLHELQEKMVSHLPKEVTDKLGISAAKPKRKTTRKSPAKKASAKKTATKKTATRKPAASKSKTLADINGVGPAMVKKLQAAGIKQLEQIANPSAADKKKLEEFKSSRGYSSWEKQAKELLS